MFTVSVSCHTTSRSPVLPARHGRNAGSSKSGAEPGTEIAVDGLQGSHVSFDGTVLGDGFHLS